jgi:hypothetical protein
MKITHVTVMNIDVLKRFNVENMLRKIEIEKNRIFRFPPTVPVRYHVDL